MAGKPGKQKQRNSEAGPAAGVGSSAGNAARRGPGTAKARRLTYGLNVAVAICAAVAILVLINILGSWKFARLDWTATRQYSLSDQSHKVIAELEELDETLEIVSLLRTDTGDANRQRARDLLEEYNRYSGALTVSFIDPTRQLTRLETFYSELLARYDVPLSNVEGAIEKGAALLDELVRQSGAQLELANTIKENPALPQGDLRAFVDSVVRELGRLGQQVERLNEGIEAARELGLPDYGGILATLRTEIGNLQDHMYVVAASQLQELGRRETTPMPLRDSLLALGRLFEASRDAIKPVLDELRQAEVPDEYREVRSQIVGSEALVILGRDQVRVVPLVDLFRPDQSAGQAPTGAPAELTFLGEEVLTGALASLMLDRQPLVVFISGGQFRALGPGGMFNQVAERLRAFNFEVQEWNPQGQPGPTGQPMPPGPLPEPEADQKAVYIVLPGNAQNPMMNPMAGQAQQETLSRVQEQIEAGAGAMFLLMVDPMAAMGMGMGDPVAQYAESWGIKAQTGRVVLEQRTLPDGQTQANPMLQVSSWPDALAVTQAVTGMPGVFINAVPLELTGDSDAGGGGEGLKTYPLARVEGPSLWAADDLQSQNPQRPEGLGPQSFILAAAAERGEQRVIFAGEPIWASDQVVTYGPAGPGTAAFFGASFPANPELFVNSVYWLAHMDQLIAASSRVQDVRRIEAISPQTRVAVQWSLLILLPLASLGAGLVVWFARRRE